MKYYLITLDDYQTAVQADSVDKTDGDLTFYLDYDITQMFAAGYWNSVHAITKDIFDQLIADVENDIDGGMH